MAILLSYAKSVLGQLFLQPHKFYKFLVWWDKNNVAAKFCPV